MGYTDAYVAPGCSLVLPAPYDRNAGEGAKVGALFGVAKVDVDSGDDAAFELTGIFDLAKLSTDVWAKGDRLYWDNTNKRLDLDSAVGMFVGVAAEVKANPSTSGRCLLAGPAELFEGAQAAVADIATADGSDAATTQALANATKAKVNALLAALRLAGIIDA